ncbi:MAG: ATP-binding protein, partial [Bacteroidetes bacterium]|nr:ATP-binding protein [Bacteroidota bacterium]
DTGIGISRDKTQIIFERFRQADYEYSRWNEGSGLGLSISKAYVEMLGGKIWLESEVGQGAAFYFTIPDNPVIEKKAVFENDTNTNDEDDQGNALKILIAEDNEQSEVLLAIVAKKFSKKILTVRTC